MGFADLHMHSIYSWDGTSTVRAILKHVREHTELDVIAITDHDRIEGALEACELAPSYGLEAITGIEISTADGHLLAYFIDKPVPPGLSLRETALRVAEMGGLCAAAHPTARMANSLSAQAIHSALNDPDVSRILVGIEVYNAGLVYKATNYIAQRLADELPLAQLGNSDAHMLWMIGRGATWFAGGSAAGLRHALERGATQPVVGKACKSFDVVGQWLTRMALRRVGWVTWNAGPQAPIRFGRPAGLDFSALLASSNR